MMVSVPEGREEAAILLRLVVYLCQVWWLSCLAVDWPSEGQQSQVWWLSCLAADWPSEGQQSQVWWLSCLAVDWPSEGQQSLASLYIILNKIIRNNNETNVIKSQCKKIYNFNGVLHGLFSISGLLKCYHLLHIVSNRICSRGLT